MIFKTMKAFRRGGDVESYLMTGLSSTMKDLLSGLSKLRFRDNFQGFEATVDIAASSELGIPNPRNYVPSQRVILRQSGGGAIIDGDSLWTTDSVYLKNTGGSEATVTVYFMR